MKNVLLRDGPFAGTLRAVDCATLVVERVITVHGADPIRQRGEYGPVPGGGAEWWFRGWYDVETIPTILPDGAIPLPRGFA